MRTLTITPTPRRTDPPPAAVRGPLARAADAPLPRLAPETIERIAQRVVQLLHHEPDTHDDGSPAARDLMDAGQLARHLGLTRAWVYEHAEQLGAIQLGDGPRPRLRFDPQTAMQALDERRRRSEPQPAKPTSRARAARDGDTQPASVPLLPIHEPRSRGILARWQRTHRRNG